MEDDGERKLKLEEVVIKAIVVLNLMWCLIFPYQKLAFNGAYCHGQCPPIVNRLVGILKTFNVESNKNGEVFNPKLKLGNQMPLRKVKKMWNCSVK
jgi:hypothetical protein